MDIPSSSDPVWKAVLTGEINCQFESFGLQMLLKRLNIEVTLNPSPDTLTKCVNELHKMFVENTRLPKVQRDLEKILGKGGRSS